MTSPIPVHNWGIINLDQRISAHNYMKPIKIIRNGYSLSSLVLGVAIIISGCGARILYNHPALTEVTDDTPTANVYFIRPQPIKPKGYADNKIWIGYQGKKLLEIHEGTYTLLKIKPSKGEITTHSKTHFINNKNKLIDISRNREYHFVAGRTYFIHLKRVDEEFRGIYYDPEPVDLNTARSLSSDLYKSGLAKSEPISAIEDIPPVPEASPLEPIFPESLYPQSPYILKRPVTK